MKGKKAVKLLLPSRTTYLQQYDIWNISDTVKCPFHPQNESCEIMGVIEMSGKCPFMPELKCHPVKQNDRWSSLRVNIGSSLTHHVAGGLAEQWRTEWRRGQLGENNVVKVRDILKKRTWGLTSGRWRIGLFTYPHYNHNSVNSDCVRRLGKIQIKLYVAKHVMKLSIEAETQQQQRRPIMCLLWGYESVISFDDEGELKQKPRTWDGLRNKYEVCQVWCIISCL